jgi:hypothetical protein
MQIQSSRFKFLSVALAFAIATTPELLAQQGGSAQAAPPQAQPQSSSTAQSGQTGNTGQQPASGGTTVNPSQPPLAPVTTYPNASDTPQDQATAPPGNAQSATPDAPQPKQQPSQPVGAATAERVPTAGGAAAKPAGAAIAPAKQHQTRSLLIKIGAIAAAGAALGTVYGLSRSSPSTPPNSGAGVRK